MYTWHYKKVSKIKEKVFEKTAADKGLFCWRLLSRLVTDVLC